MGRFSVEFEVANYRVAFGPARLNTAITTSFATLFLPVIARLFARGELDELRRSYWHTAEDTMDKLSARSFQIVGDITIALVRDLDSAD